MSVLKKPAKPSKRVPKVVSRRKSDAVESESAKLAAKLTEGKDEAQDTCKLILSGKVDNYLGTIRKALDDRSSSVAAATAQEQAKSLSASDIVNLRKGDTICFLLNVTNGLAGKRVRIVSAVKDDMYRVQIADPAERAALKGRSFGGTFGAHRKALDVKTLVLANRPGPRTVPADVRHKKGRL